MSNALKLIKVLVSIGLLVILAMRVDWPQIVHEISKLSWWVFVVVLVLQVLSITLANGRWWAILRTDGLGYRFIDLLPQYYIGSFFNNLLPTSTGGDLFRMYYIYKRGHGAALAVSPVIVERVIGLVILVGMAVVALPFLQADLSGCWGAMVLANPACCG